jgi:hypothetical protein
MSQERNAEQTAYDLRSSCRKMLLPFTDSIIASQLSVDFAIFCVERILGANPTHIDCNSTDSDYGFWMEVRKKLLSFK